MLSRDETVLFDTCNVFVRQMVTYSRCSIPQNRSNLKHVPAHTNLVRWAWNAARPGRAPLGYAGSLGPGHIAGSVPSVWSATGQTGQFTVGARPMPVFCIPTKRVIHRPQMSSALKWYPQYDELTYSFLHFFIQSICYVLILYLGCIVRWQLRPMPSLSCYRLYTILPSKYTILLVSSPLRLASLHRSPSY